MTYRPDPKAYQQLVPWTPTGYADCTAWTAAWVSDFSTLGKVKLTGRQIRLATNEPIPDPVSPGLNLPQVDMAVRNLTHGALDPDTRLGFGIMEAEAKVKAGAMSHVQVTRGVLYDRVEGMRSHGFRGGHDIGVFSAADGRPVIFDPLIPRYVTDANWLDVWVAASALIGQPGRANVQFGLDVTRTYRMRFTGGGFYAYRLENSVIVGRKAYYASGGQVRTCSRPYTRPWPGHNPRTIVRVPDTRPYRDGYEWIAVPQKNVRLEEVL